MPRRQLRLAVVACAWVAAATAHAGDAAGALRRTDALFVWSPAVAMTDGGDDDDEAQRRLLARCERDGIGRIHFLIDPARHDRSSLRRFLVRARAGGVDVWALTPGGLQRAWVAPLRSRGAPDPGPVLDWLGRALALEDRDGGAAFGGIQVDVEPHTARAPGARRPAWRSGRQPLTRRRNVALVEGYLDLLDALAERSGGRRIAATVPSWWDRPDLDLRRSGVRGSLLDHVRARVDLITVMAYRSAADRASREALLDDVEGEIAGGPTEVLLETARSARTGPGRRETLHAGGMRRFVEVRREMFARFGGRAGFLGVGAHAYLDAYASGTRRWP